jgi:hypothetical protein
MQKVPLPDYREIEVNISVANIKDQVAALFYATGLVFDNETVVDLELGRGDFGIGYVNTDVIPVTFRLKKHQQVDLVKHIWLGYQSPKERTMNVQNTTSVDAGLAEAPVHVFNAETGRFEDALGNPVHTEEVAVVTTEGEVASSADVTIH